jgi:hypothetical protein
MRDYVDPWAHNLNGGGGGGSSQMSASGSFGMGNNQNSGSNFGNNMDVDGKQSTQVTIPKDVRSCLRL